MSAVVASPIERSARPGAASRLLVRIDALPGHGWWVFPAMTLLLLAWAHVVLWVSSTLPVGTFEPTIAVGVIYGPYSLAAIAYLDRVAVRALASFWPATGWPEGERAAWAYAFVTTPSGFELPAFLIGVAVAVASFLSASSWTVGGDSASRAALFVAYLPIGLFGYGMMPVAFIHIARQLRLVARIHREATAIDPFDRVPLYAFSRLTVQAGAVFVLSAYYTVTVNASFQSGNVVGLAALGSFFVLATACFVLPLWGIHERLVHEKELLLKEVEGRVSRLGGEMYRRIDAGEFDATKVINDSLAGVTALRDRIARLPTWPWPPQVLRGFVSALLLPVVVYLVSRVISSQIGA